MRNLFPSVLIALMVGSCAPRPYVQMGRAQAEGAVVKNEALVFENADCRVSYQLWAPGGDVGFVFYNQSEHDLTIYLDQTFLVVNDWSTAYFQNRTFTQSQNQFASTSVYFNDAWLPFAQTQGRTHSQGTEYHEKSSLVVPARTQVRLSEFQLLKKPLLHPDLDPHPRKKQVRTAAFTQDTSPLRFSNRITYANPTDTVRFENVFYLSELTNYPAKMGWKHASEPAPELPKDADYSDLKPLYPDGVYVLYWKR